MRIRGSKKIMIGSALAVAAAFGCGVDRAMSPASPLKIELQIPSVVRTGQVVAIAATVTNTSALPVTQGLVCGSVTLDVIRSDGVPIFEGEKGLHFGCADVLHLEPGEAREFRSSIGGPKDELSPGTFNFTVSLYEQYHLPPIAVSPVRQLVVQP